MGVFDDDPGKGIDTSVGGLVWVRRRNGSWWPGRILGADELPEGCAPTPRAGTPVKLLGREDASVDWYNLEKSKRVKAFRCGEYDDCIEKAKASISRLSKKDVKYARREDAILHALEIESAQLAKDVPDLSDHQDSQDGIHPNNNKFPSSLHSSEDTDKDLSDSKDESESGPELSQSGVSFESPDPTKEASKRWRTPNDSEDDGMGGVKRMKGLEDLGLRVSASPKRKRSQVAHVHESMKRKNRRRTLTKVLECTAMVSIPASDQLYSPTGSSVPGASDSKVSGVESNESKKNNSNSTGVSREDASKCGCDASQRSKDKENEISSMVETPENESCVRLSVVPSFAEEKKSSAMPTIVSGGSQKTNVRAAAQSSQSSHVETVSLTIEDCNESGSTSTGYAEISIGEELDKGTSKWQLKGKRNSRSRKADPDDETKIYAAGVDASRAGGSLISNDGGYRAKFRHLTEFRAWSWNGLGTESHTKGSTSDSVPQRSRPYRQSRLTVNPKYENSDFTLDLNAKNSGLYDVTIEVKTSHRPPRVPYISLMSKLTSQPVIGHPLSVDVLEDGFCDDTPGVSEFSSSSEQLDSTLNKGSASGGTDLVYERRSGGRPPAMHFSSPTTKSPKSTKKNGLLSKKIRKLSSLTGSRKQNPSEKKMVMEKLKGPSIACVPVKIVFSRINAALNNTAHSTVRSK